VFLNSCREGIVLVGQSGCRRVIVFGAVEVLGSHRSS
jgi:hypothetical protein